MKTILVERTSKRGKYGQHFTQAIVQLRDGRRVLISECWLSRGLGGESYGWGIAFPVVASDTLSQSDDIQQRSDTRAYEWDNKTIAKIAHAVGL